MMTKSSFVMNTDPDTHLRFITKTDELSKNHRGSDSQAHTGFMTETGTTNCPVASFTKFLSKLHPDQNRLWCYGRDAFDPNDNVWYTRKPVGINTLDKFLPELSQRCNLSRVYTNHSIRATTATVHVLHQERFDLKEVQSVTGHKSLSSLAIYQRTSGHQKHTMAKALHSRVTGTQNSENCTPWDQIFASRRLSGRRHNLFQTSRALCSRDSPLPRRKGGAGQNWKRLIWMFSLIRKMSQRTLELRPAPCFRTARSGRYTSILSKSRLIWNSALKEELPLK